ncbi:MAG: hypothetical protein COB04_13075 [Gammaproteobacteria bacterium]|nr:MAG: hypothetical protein COB04_13075 [Gammaproteobacteria bacterium]
MRRQIQTFFRGLVKKETVPSEEKAPDNSKYIPEQSYTEEEDEAKVLGSVVETRIGRYRLEKFEAGGVCQIFRGVAIDDDEDAKPRPNIAVKRIRPKWHKHSAVQEQFQREIGIIRDFIHPSLPQYVDRGDLAGQDFYAYEFIDGYPLIHLCQNKDRFPLELVQEIAVSVLKQLLSQLSYLHEQMYTIVHGDISAENVLINDAQKVYLVDFGCAYRRKKVSEESYQWLGKPSYISPEQAQGDTWDQRSDLYQVAILFYELVSAQRWNQGKDSKEKILSASSKQTPADDFLVPFTSPGVSKLISEMLEPDQHKRIQSANECYRRLEQAEASSLAKQ